MDFLPTPPDDRQKYLYVKPNKAFMYLYGILSTLLVLVGGVFFALHTIHFVWFLLFVGIIGFYLGISYVIGVFSKSFDLKAHKRVVALGRGFYPAIDVYLPCCGEPVAVIKNTHYWVSKLRWPKEKIKIWVLDDGENEEVRASAEKFGYTYVIRPNRGVLKKAGNIRHAFSVSEGELILVLDADFCPREDFLEEVVPYFQDPKMGIVQTPQFFDVLPDMTDIERGASSVQELFYRLIQANRDQWMGSICVGSCAVYRRKALEPYGGTYPIQHSEDVHTGFCVIKDGWILKYIPVNLSKGRCPDSVGAFFIQQYRWCSGSTSLLFNSKLFWGTRLGAMRRICYLSGMLYYTATALGLFITPLPGLIMVWFKPEHVLWYNLVFSVPSFLFGIFYLKLWNKTPYGFFTMRARAISYYAHVFALYDKFRSTVLEWVPTGNAAAVKSTKKVTQFKRLMFLWPTITSLLGIIGFLLHSKSLLDYNFYPFLFFLGFYNYLQLSVFWKERE